MAIKLSTGLKQYIFNTGQLTEKFGVSATYNLRLQIYDSSVARPTSPDTGVAVTAILATLGTSDGEFDYATTVTEYTLLLGAAVAGILARSGTWTGKVRPTGTLVEAVWWRLVGECGLTGDNPDDGTTTVTTCLRIDGACAEGAVGDLCFADLTLVNGAAITADTFQFTIL